MTRIPEEMHREAQSQDNRFYPFITGRQANNEYSISQSLFAYSRESTSSVITKNTALAFCKILVIRRDK